MYNKIVVELVIAIIFMGYLIHLYFRNWNVLNFRTGIKCMPSLYNQLSSYPIMVFSFRRLNIESWFYYNEEDGSFTIK